MVEEDESDLDDSSSTSSDVKVPDALEHSYMPGASHPLCPDIHVRRDRTSELVVMELPGVVLFPGSTIPIRLHDSGWINILGPQIEESRRRPNAGSTIRFGVLTQQEPVVSESRQRRQSWARRGYGQYRLTRLSERLMAELGDLDNLESGNSSSEDESDQAPSVDRFNGSALPRSSIRSTSSYSSGQSSTDPYVGRVGTIATVTYTHGDAAGEGSNSISSTEIWARHEHELNITAIGTARFRIISRTGRAGVVATGRGPQRFVVEEFADSCFEKTDLRWCRTSSASVERNGLGPQYENSLGIVSAAPSFLWKNLPSSLVPSIRELLQSIPSTSGVSDGLHSLEEHAESKLGNTAISFWLASNLSFTQDEKVRLLEIPSTTERLLSIREFLRKLEKVESLFYCKSCTAPIVSADQLFTVGGAEGTTGAYVNENGCVHQTVTLRELDENEVTFHGIPETKDSWFPGYAWTIMSCAFCGSHLGWKFTSTSGRNRHEDLSVSRPNFFYGISAANIVTRVRRHRRRSSARQSGLDRRGR